MAVQKITLTASGTTTLANNNIFSSYYVTCASSITLATGYVFTMSSPRIGQRVKFEYNPKTYTITVTAGVIEFMGVSLPGDYASKKINVDCYFDGVDWTVDFTPAFQQTDIINSGMVKDVAVAKITGTASKVMEFTAGGIGQASATTTTELATIAGVTPGTAAASKALVLKADKTIDEIDVTALKLGGTAITASAAELNKMDGVTATFTEINTLAGVTPGTVAASKAVVLGPTSKINTLDVTALYINGQVVAASGTELSQLNSAGVLAADFAELEDLAANGVVKADLALLAGAAAAGVTASSLADIASATDAPSKVRIKTATHTDDYTIDNATGVLCLTLSADSIIDLPDGSVDKKQVIDIIIVDNPASAFDIQFADAGSTFLYAGTTNSDTKTIAAPAPGSMIKLVNSAANVWTIGTT